MTRALLIRSIPLASSTRDAWKEAGAFFARRDSDADRVDRIRNGNPVINLGNSAMDMPYLWNRGSVILPLINPMTARALLDGLMPSGEWEGEGYYWLKGEGRGGANKERLFIETAQAHHELWLRAHWMQGDVQQDTVGAEYRVITVGHKVVQVALRTGLNGNRRYEWVGVTNARPAVKGIARDAARMLGSEKTIIGWDVMDTEMGAYILEGNSCPGVNEATANRILNEIEGIGY